MFRDIDFRLVEIDPLYQKIINLIHDQSTPETEEILMLAKDGGFDEELFANELNLYFDQLLFSLQNQALEEGQSYTEATIMFSLYCQNLFYYIAHNISEPIKTIALKCLLDQELLFVKDRDGKVIFHNDQKYDSNILLNAVTFNLKLCVNEIVNKIIDIGGNTTLAWILSQKNKRTFDCLKAAAESHDSELVTLILDYAKNAMNETDFYEYLNKKDLKNTDGNTILNWVAYIAEMTPAPEEKLKLKAIMKILLAYGANPNIKNSQGRSARNRDHANIIPHTSIVAKAPIRRPTFIEEASYKPTTVPKPGDAARAERKRKREADLEMIRNKSKRIKR